MLDYNDEGRPFLNYGEKVQPSKDICNSMSAKEAEDHMPDDISEILDRGFDRRQLGLKLATQEQKDMIVAYQDKQAFNLLYETLQEVHEILHRGIRDGEKGYKRAILKAEEKLRGIE